MRSGLVWLLVVILAFSVLGLTGCSSPAEDVDNGGAEETEKIDFPTREIRIVVPYPAGGGSDRTARRIEKIVRENNFLSQPIVVVNVAGAGSVLGQEEVLGARPDGHTLLLHHTAFLTAYSLGMQDIQYSDFEPVAGINYNPLAVVVKADAPWNTMEELIEDAKNRPGEIVWSWSGMGGNTHFASAAVLGATGIDVNPMIADGGGEAVSWLLGGHADVMVEQFATFIEYVIAGDMKVLATTSAERLDMLPDVPTLLEQGVDVEMVLRNALWAPPGTPKEAIAVLEDCLRKVTEHPEWVQAAEDEAFVVDYKTAAEIAEVFAKDYEMIKPIAEELKAEMER